MKIVPLQDRVLIRRIASDKVTKGGIYIPPSAQEKQSEGVILSVGPGKEDDQGRLHEIKGLKVGDHVLFGRYAGVDLKQGDEEVVLVNANDVLGLLAD